MKYTTFRRRFRRRGSAAGFTLVEMLAVMGIVGFLTTLTVLSVRGLGGGTSRKAAIGTLMGVFDQARMMAISDGRPTYVVFVSVPKNETDLTTSTLPDSMWGRAYALFEDPVITDTSVATSFNPVQRSGWLYLPTGVAFKCDSSDYTPPNVTATTRLAADSTQFNIPSRTSAPTVPLKLPYVRFDGMGQVINYAGSIVDANDASLRVLLFQGTADKNSTEICTTPTAVNSTDQTVGKKYAVDEILLKPTTGRAEYTLDPINNLVAASTTP